MSDWEEVLKLALPAVAGFYAGHQGQIGPYSQGLMQSQHQIDQTTNQRRQQDQQQSWHQEQIHQQNIDNDRQQQALDAQMANHQLAQQAAQAEAERKDHERKSALIQNYFNEAAKDYGTTDFVKKFGKDAFSIDVPGIGPISLQKAMEMGAVPPANFGTATPPPERQPALITTPGPDGKPIRGVDAPGASVYERPPADSLVPIPGPDGKPIYGPRTAGSPVYERPHPPTGDTLVPVPAPEGGATWGPRTPGGKVYERPRPEPQEPLVPIPSDSGEPVWGAKTPGGKVYERPRLDPALRETPLVPTPSGKGGAVWGKKKEGAPVYEKAADKKPTTRSYVWKADDPDDEETFGKSYRIVEDDNGNIISQTRITSAEIRNGKPVKPSAGGKADPLGIR